MQRLGSLWADERPAAALWTPVLFGLGAQIYFWAASEPSVWLLLAGPIAPFLIWTIFWRRLAAFRLLGFALTLVGLGFSWTGTRAQLAAAPVLTTQIDATVEGVIRDVERTQSGRPRLVLDDLVIFGVVERATPRVAQISLLRERDIEGLRPGARVSVFAHLGPPGGPVEPGGFDFRRVAWFEGLGAVGYARGAPVEIPVEGRPGLIRRIALALARDRAAVSAGLRERLPGETGAFAAAVSVGDRAGITRDSLQALRDSNLAHLLAISGLHMGLVTALVFGAVRVALALTPIVARRWRTKRAAAIIALGAATAYLLLSGASVATQRAYIMAVVALGAVILNRPAITMRALATAALAILIVRPESLAHVGFQMSFAATAAIIAGFDFARERGWSARFIEKGPAGRFGGYVLALAATSFLAGTATAPFAAFHFNQMSHYGLAANLVAVPLMGFVVAPAGLIASALAPFGLEAPALWVMGRGIEAILVVARFVAGLDGATRPVQATAPVVLTLIVFGGLGLCLGRRAVRGLGAALAIVGLAIWVAADVRPLALAAPEGRLLGVMGPEGRRLDHASAEGYAAGVWLQRDGDRAEQEEAAARGGFERGYAGAIVELANGWRIANVLSRTPDRERLDELCAPRTVVLAPGAGFYPGAPDMTEGGCLFYDRPTLDRAGALSFDLDGDGIRIETAAGLAGDRLWTRWRGEGADGTAAVGLQGR